MASHVAASAYAHCLALVRDEGDAARLAEVAARRGGRALGTVLGHARYLALDHLGHQPDPGPEPLTAGTPAGEVAWALARTRPPVELAVVDLSGRYGLGRAGLGLALRLSPSSAAARVAAADRAWSAALDPALLAWLGPGDCDGLAAVLGEREPVTSAELLALGAEVGDHTGGCPSCTDRLRAMPSVRLLVNGAPLVPAPPTVEAAAAGGRFQPPAPPPPLEPGRAWSPARVVAAVAAVLAVAGAVVALARAGDGGGRDDDRAVAPVAGHLRLVPAELAVSASQVLLRNSSGAAVGWEAATDAPWLDVQPARGRIPAGGRQALVLRGAPPEGDVRAAVRVSGDDGSAAATTVAGTVEHPPELDAAADGCRVVAKVEDEGEVAVTLHWRVDDGPERTSPMQAADTGPVASLPPGPGRLVWWVSAVDGRGNQARTGDTTLRSGC